MGLFFTYLLFNQMAVMQSDFLHHTIQTKPNHQLSKYMLQRVMKNTVTSINILWIRGTNTRCFSATAEIKNFTHLLLIDQNNACSVTQGLSFQVELMIILVLKYFTLELIHKEALTHYKDFHNNFCQKIIVKIVAHI